MEQFDYLIDYYSIHLIGPMLQLHNTDIVFK